MARLFTDASNHYLEIDSPVITEVPFTAAGWFRPTDGHNGCIWSVVDKDANNAMFAMLITSGGFAEVRTRASTTSDASGTTTNSYTVGAWNHLAIVCTSATLREVYLNGDVANKGTSTTSKTPAGIDRTSIGRIGRLSPVLPFNGRIEHVTCWNAALSLSELAVLAGGVHPARIRPSNIVGRWPVWGLHSPEIDLAAGLYPLTVTGATLAEGAPVRPFGSRFWGSYPVIEAAGGPTFQPAWASQSNSLVGVGAVP